jgi:polyhydroxyalkanoate synthesis regulator phasin
MAGAIGEEVGKVANKMISEGKIKQDRAEEILKEIR